jgi:hypothetical protein
MKPTAVDLEKYFDDPTVLGKLVRFEELNEDSVQILFREPNDSILTQGELCKIPYVNDWKSRRDTAIWRYRMQKNNAFLFWETLRLEDQERLVQAYGLESFENLLFFFHWFAGKDKKFLHEYQKVVRRFGALKEEEITTLI